MPLLCTCLKPEYFLRRRKRTHNSLSILIHKLSPTYAHIRPGNERSLKKLSSKKSKRIQAE